MSFRPYLGTQLTRWRGCEAPSLCRPYRPYECALVLRSRIALRYFSSGLYLVMKHAYE